MLYYSDRSFGARLVVLAGHRRDIVDLVESYNFCIKIISIRVRMKKDIIFLKSDLVTPAGVA